MSCTETSGLCITYRRKTVYNRTWSVGFRFVKKEVCDYVIAAVRQILKDNPIDYVKWDMNRHLTDVGSMYFEPDRQGEITHRYVLGLLLYYGRVNIGIFGNII